MSYDDTHEFIRVLESRGELRRIGTEVSPDVEIAEITRSVRDANGPALLFENVKGVGFPILTNVFGSYERLKIALDLEDFDSVSREILDLFLTLGHEMSFSDKMTLLSRLARIVSLFPKRVRTGSCKDVVVRRPSLHMLPAIRCLPEESSRSVSLCSCFVVPPAGGVQNVSMCRMVVFDKVTAGIKWSLHDEIVAILSEHKKLGRAMEVAVVLGGDPATMYSATVSLPRNIDKMIFAGLLRNSAVELIKCETVDIWVPAHSEIVLEGYVELSDPETAESLEASTRHLPVFHLKHITHRRNAICPATVVDGESSDMDFMAWATERIFLPLLRLQLPEIVELNTPLEGIMKGCVIVSIRKRYPGHARKVMHALWGMEQTMLAKEIIVVDEFVDPHDVSSVLDRVLRMVDFDMDLEIVRGPVSESSSDYGYKFGIDATVRLPGEAQRETRVAEKRMIREVGSAVIARWKSRIPL